MALAQLQLKRMLAFVTMSHLGIYLIGIGLLTPLGLTGASLLVIGDGLAKSALFLGVGVLQHQRASVSETKLRGRGRGLAVTGVTIVLGALVLADLPPFVSSAGHALLVDAADQAGLPWLEIVIALSVIVSSGAVLRAAARIWLGWGDVESPDAGTGTADDPGEEAEGRPDTASPGGTQDQGERSGQQRRVPLTMVLPPLALLAIGLGLGLTSGLEEHATAAAAAFWDWAAYAAAVLGTHSGSVPVAGRIAVPASPAASAGGVFTDLGQVLAALCVAGIALGRRSSRLRRHRPPAPDGCAGCTAAWSVSRLPGWWLAWRCSPPSVSGRCTEACTVSSGRVRAVRRGELARRAAEEASMTSVSLPDPVVRRTGAPRVDARRARARAAGAGRRRGPVRRGQPRRLQHRRLELPPGADRRGRPARVEDAVAAVAVCRELGAPVVSRGGGTSLAGQTCNVAVVIDWSKYCHNVVSVDPVREAAWSSRASCWTSSTPSWRRTG